MKKLILLFVLLYVCNVFAQVPARHQAGVVLGDPIGTGADPTGVAAGQIYWNATLGKFRKYDGSVWSDLVSGTGATQLNELTDVTSATQSAGFVLISDGGNYYGRALLTADISDFVGLEAVVDDPTPQLGGNLDVNNYTFVTTSSGNIAFDPDGTGVTNIFSTLYVYDTNSDTNILGAGDTVIAGYIDSTGNYTYGDGGVVIKTDGTVTAPNMSIAEINATGSTSLITKEYADANYASGSGDVTAAVNFANDNRVIRSDGTTKGVQASGVTLSDTNNLTGVNDLGAGGNVTVSATTDKSVLVQNTTSNDQSYISPVGVAAYDDSAGEYIELVPTGQALQFRDLTFKTSLVATNATADRTATLKDESGTIAYLTDITGTNSGTNTGDQTITNTSDATSHTATLSASGGSIQLVEGANITLTTTGTASDGIVTIASTGGTDATTASNGLTEVGDDIRLGGTLTGATTITQGTNILTFNSTSTGTGFQVNNNNGNGGFVRTQFNGARALDAIGIFTTTNSNQPIFNISRQTTGTPASGIGAALEFNVEQSTGNLATPTGSLMVNWTDPTNATRTSEFKIDLYDTAVRQNVLAIDGNGTVSAPQMSTAEITAKGNTALITKEYGDANYLGGGGDDVSTFAEKTGDLVGTDRLVGLSGATDFSETISGIPLSIFNNDSGWTSNTGTVTTTGSPVDSHIPVFTNGTTIEGDDALIFDTSANTLQVGVNDSSFGWIKIFGDAISSGNANLDLYNNTSTDTDVDFWRVGTAGTASGDFRISAGSGNNIIIIDDVTKNITLGNYTFDEDQTVGAGQDNFVLTYDNGTGLVSLEAATGGSGINNVVEDTTPQLGGNLDLNTFDITSTSAADIDVTGADLQIGDITASGARMRFLTTGATTEIRGNTNRTFANLSATIDIDADNNGTGETFRVRSNNSLNTVLQVHEDGTVTAPSMSTAEITSAGNTALITKEYGDANYGGGSGDDVSTFSEKTGNLVGTDRLVGLSGATDFLETINQIPLSIFSNDAGWISGNESITLSGDVTGTGTTAITTTIANGAVDIGMLSATGTPSATTYLRGDNTWATVAGGGDVTKVGTPVDNEIGVWTGDGTIEGTSGFTFNSLNQSQTIGLDDSDNGFISIYGDAANLGGTLRLYNGGTSDTNFQYFSMDADNATFTLKPSAAGQASSLILNSNVTLSPVGTGNVTLGTMTIDGDQTLGAGQDNFVLTYDNGTGLAQFEAATGGNVTKVGTPVDNQIGVWTGDGTIEGDPSFTFDAASNIFQTGQNGIENGTVSAMGGSTVVGGSLRAYNGGSFTGENQYFNMRANTTGDFEISGSTTGVFLNYDGGTGTVDISPTSTGNVTVGNYTLDGDQTVGAGQDNFVLTYDNGTGLVSLEAATGGSGDDVSTFSEKSGNLVGTDRLVGNSGGTDFLETINQIPLSIFSNDAGFDSKPTLSKGVTIPDILATDDPTLFYTPVAITVTDVRSHITAGTNVVYNINHATTRTGTGLDVFTSDITETSTAGAGHSTGFNDNTIPAGSYVWLDVVSVSGSVSLFHATIIYTED